MKKTAAYLAMTLLLALALCGCGNDRTNTVESPAITPMVSVSPSATVSPDMEDGIVEDTDGIIGDEGTTDAGTGNMADASASPSTAVKK